MFVTSLIFKITWDYKVCIKLKAATEQPVLIRLIRIFKKRRIWVLMYFYVMTKNTLQWDISFSNQLKIMSLPKGSTIILLCTVMVWYIYSEYVYSFFQVVLKWYSYSMHMFSILTCVYLGFKLLFAVFTTKSINQVRYKLYKLINGIVELKSE